MGIKFLNELTCRGSGWQMGQVVSKRVGLTGEI